MTAKSLLLFVCFGSYVHSGAEKVYFLDTLNATEELAWKAHSSLGEKEGWSEETYRSETDNLNHQAYSTCNVEHANVENWLLLPRIDRHGAQRLYIEIKFTMRKCAEVPSARKYCKETLRLYASQVPENRSLADSWWSDAHWVFMDMIAPNTEADAPYVQTSSLAVNSSSVYFALKDSGACTSVLYVKIYHVIGSADESIETKLRMTKITLHLTRNQKLEFLSDSEYQAFKARNPEYFD
ncbi:Ephrin receptor ligand binding domain containing protein [Aphelenchoides avenae]|nr:Ephrin receptor ligand binding domain containing protein [Aphelenchus avenae]